MSGTCTAGAPQAKAPGAMLRPRDAFPSRGNPLFISAIAAVCLASVCLASMMPIAAHACSAMLERGKTIDSARHGIAYRTDPARIAVGKPFALDLAVCPKDAAATIDELRVDAHMPEHRHGMNYKASVKPQGAPGRYRAEGLMFHMPGKWEFLFDVRDAKGVERLQQDYPLK